MHTHRPFRHRSLHARFRTVLLLIALTLSSVLGASVYVMARGHYLAAGESAARALVSAVQQSLAIGVYARDAVLLDELVGGIAHHPSVAAVVVLDGTGQRLARIDDARAKAGEDDPAAAAPDASPAAFETPLASPFDAAETVGRLQVWLDTPALAADARRQASLLVGGLATMLLAMLAVFNLLASRLLSRPMHALAGQLARIQPGQSERLQVDERHRDDEVGVVATAANQLLDLQQQALARERSMREEIAALEAQYRGIFDSTSAGIFLMSPDGALLQANPALARLLGGTPQATQFAATHFVEPAAWWRIVDAARVSGQPEAADLQILRGDGQPIWVHCMVSFVVDAEGTAGGGGHVEGVLYDVTERKRHEAATRHQAEHDALTGLKSRAFIEASLDRQLDEAADSAEAVTLMFIDLDGFKAVNDRWGHAAGDAVLVEAARRLQTLFQRRSDSVGRLGGDELVVMIEGFEATHPSIGERAAALIDSLARSFTLPNGEQAVVGASVGVASFPLHATTAQTLIHAADAAMYAVKQSGKGGFVIAAPHDGEHLAPRRVAQRAAEPAPPAAAAMQLAGRDPLTGLLDRWQLAERLAAPLAAQRTPQASCLVCVDIDHFNTINLTHGQQVGDEVLREAARRLQAAVRSADLVARTGGDEFVVLAALEGQDAEADARTALALANKLLCALQAPWQGPAGPVALRASAGVAVGGPSASNAGGVALLREAQLALRRAKAQGRGKPTMFEAPMRSGFEAEVSLEEDLRAAIGTPQFFLHVQPQVDRHGRRVGGEVLARWQHPSLGLVPPDRFIALAEACGAIVELGRWVLREGCALLAQLQRAELSQTLSINISPAQFNHPDFVDEVKTALRLAGAAPHTLVLELTEGLLITDLAHVTRRMRELVDFGVRLSIDDFGTGFSSLAYLRQLPLHEIKIDRSFVAGLPHDVPNAGIVRSILAMGSHLGMQVVAEGVETEEQARYLAAQGCPAQQGWLHGRPMPAERFVAAAIEAADSRCAAPA